MNVFDFERRRLIKFKLNIANCSFRFRRIDFWTIYSKSSHSVNEQGLIKCFRYSENSQGKDKRDYLNICFRYTMSQMNDYIVIYKSHN